MPDSCYIYQKNDLWKDIPIGGYTMGSAGCVIACAAMCICHRFGITIDDGNDTYLGKKQVVEAVIANCVNANGYFYSNAFIAFDPEIYGYGSNQFYFTSTKSTPDMYGWPIAHYKYWSSQLNDWGYHAISYTSPTTVLDPNNVNNTSKRAVEATYGTTIDCYWPH